MTSDIDTALGLMEWDRKRKKRIYSERTEARRQARNYYQEYYAQNRDTILYHNKLRRCGVSIPATTSPSGNAISVE